ncbi:hypothetical protein [Occallatibacter savannae]|uniref:hypothetical protein n=1 Tax=Occallatibacter savannae TaxID=1002691 RepID=UPI000D689E25|nr:hypothetical protein [Occallatibacter savannae]
MTRPRALLLGNEPQSLCTRKMLLDTRFQVSVSVRTSEALKLIEAQPVELIVIWGDSERWKQVAEFAANQNPGLKTILITSDDAEKTNLD